MSEEPIIRGLTSWTPEELEQWAVERELALRLQEYVDADQAMSNVIQFRPRARRK
jgi:hypothetical protein